MNLRNKNILITGVGKGLGKSMVEYFLKSGAYIYGITRSKSDIKKFESNKKLKIFHGDVRNISTIKKILNQSIKDKKFINGLINNAGIRQRLEFEKIKPNDIKEIFDINFFSIFEILKIYIEYVKKNNIKSSVVNIGSIVGETGFKHLSGYSATKGALKSLTQCLATEFADRNIRLNVVSPGFTETSYFSNFKKNKKLYDWTLSNIPMARWGKSEEVSAVTAFLISDLSSYITGETINIDGGWIRG